MYERTDHRSARTHTHKNNMVLHAFTSAKNARCHERPEKHHLPPPSVRKFPVLSIVHTHTTMKRIHCDGTAAELNHETTLVKNWNIKLACDTCVIVGV